MTIIYLGIWFSIVCVLSLVSSRIDKPCGYALENCSGKGEIRFETPKGKLIMHVCKNCVATEKGSIY